MILKSKLYSEIKTLAFIRKGVAVQGNIGIWNVFTTRYR